MRKTMIGVSVAIGGFSSEVGKTALMCELLRAFPGWEAIKMTRVRFASWLQNSSERDTISALPVYTREDLPNLIARIQAIHAPVAA